MLDNVFFKKRNFDLLFETKSKIRVYRRNTDCRIMTLRLNTFDYEKAIESKLDFTDECISSSIVEQLDFNFNDNEIIEILQLLIFCYINEINLTADKYQYS